MKENVNKPRIVYYNTPDGFKDTPEDQKMIKKMINVYRALSRFLITIGLLQSES